MKFHAVSVFFGRDFFCSHSVFCCLFRLLEYTATPTRHSTMAPSAPSTSRAASSESRPSTAPSNHETDSSAGPSPPPRRGEDPAHAAKGRNAKAEAASKKAGADPREKQDPKKVGPWRIGKTIGTGSSGQSSIPALSPPRIRLGLFPCFVVFFAYRPNTPSERPVNPAPSSQVASRLLDTRIRTNTPPSRLCPNRDPRRPVPLQRPTRFVAPLSRISQLTDASYTPLQMLLGIEREIVIMKLIEHPNVLRLMDVWETGSELSVVLHRVSVYC